MLPYIVTENSANSLPIWTGLPGLRFSAVGQPCPIAGFFADAQFRTVGTSLELQMRIVDGFLLFQSTPEASGSDGDGGRGLFRSASRAVWDQTVDLLKWVGGISINLIWAGLLVVTIVWITNRLRRRLRIYLETQTKGKN